MRIIHIDDVKTHFSHLVEQAARGKPFIISKAGKPVAKVVPWEPEAVQVWPRLGFLQGQFQVPDDFDRMGQADIEALFVGSKGR